jgi:S-adenosylmethionine:tRNA ribosyltransferase-isomerase
VTLQDAIPVTRFSVPPGSDATAPPERRGVPRDGIRLLVVRPGVIEHRRFHDLPDLLDPGDLVVVNISATLPAAVDARRADGRRVSVHISTVLDDGGWVVEVRRPDGNGPDLTLEKGAALQLAGQVELRLTSAYPDPTAEMSRLWRADVTPPPLSLSTFLVRYGHPVRYGHVRKRFPLADYQTVFAADPGSAEMPSAGRAFTAPLVVRLVTHGVVVAPVVLHAGVSSPELHEPPTPERFQVPVATARLVNGTRSAGNRVVAVGTTVTRALESAAMADGTVHPAGGWTNLVLGPGRPARAVTGLITGLHAPEASHLLLLEAVAGPRLVDTAYRAAVEQGYLWHEFGDATLFLP